MKKIIIEFIENDERQPSKSAMAALRADDLALCILDIYELTRSEDLVSYEEIRSIIEHRIGDIWDYTE